MESVARPVTLVGGDAGAAEKKKEKDENIIIMHYFG